MSDCSSKKKIGVMTITKVGNYGADLQAYALVKKLNELGFDAEIIDYLFYKHRDYVFTKSARPFVKLGAKKKIKEFVFPIIENVKSLTCRRSKRNRDLRFREFYQKYMRLSKETFCSFEDLYNVKFDYDVYMAGSDQVWNPYSNATQEPYFLTFGPVDRPKVSYASSFGVQHLPASAKEKYEKFLNEFDFISVREKQGVRIVEDLTGRKAEHVLDPTLLLDKDDWSRVAKKTAIEKPYILLYVLTETPYITNLAKQMAAILGWDIVRICKNAVREDRGKVINNIIDAGPSEFIGLFLQSSFVITNSFHGTAFAVNFSKPFYSVLRRGKSNNCRQRDFLESLDLENRIFNEGDDLPDKKNYALDFSRSNELLEEQRGKSLNYLKKVIEGLIYA